jgi:predicted membrane channel-forming protein YqfA (hemolysin III family)
MLEDDLGCTCMQKLMAVCGELQVLSFSGAIINVLRIPEKWFHDQDAAENGVRKAGPFDCWLNSHQIMHVLVALAMLHLHWGAADDCRYFVSHPDQCSTMR